MISQENIELIERYLSHELSESERSALDMQISDDKELMAEFQRRETAHLALDFMIAENLRGELKALNANEGNKIVSLVDRRKRLSYLAIAASVIILVGAFFVIFPSNGAAPYQLAMTNYETPDFAFRSNTAALPVDLANGISALQDGNYANAINQLESVSLDGDFALLSDFYLGHAYFLSARYSDARQRFETVAKGNDRRYVADAQWYSLLSCLAQEIDCSAGLNDIVNDKNHSHHQSALKIERKLN